MDHSLSIARLRSLTPPLVSPPVAPGWGAGGWAVPPSAGERRINYTEPPVRVCRKARSAANPGGDISRDTSGPRAPTPRRLADLDLEAHLRDPARKQRFVTPMFDLIAPKYDRFTRVFSFGMDSGWKREMMAILALRVARDAHIVDLACGTGDLAFAAAALAPAGRVVGIDASPRMIEMARERAAGSPHRAMTHFVLGDASAPELPDASADAATGGYALRNVPDYRVAVREVARILRPGGVFVTLDFYRPESRIWRTLFLAYLSIAGNLVGWLWHREPVAYGYIARSIDGFVSWQQFSRALVESGLIVEEVRPKLLGGVAIHVARKPQSPT